MQAERHCDLHAMPQTGNGMDAFAEEQQQTRAIATLSRIPSPKSQFPAYSPSPTGLLAMS